jgi:hypothetical protein
MAQGTDDALGSIRVVILCASVSTALSKRSTVVWLYSKRYEQRMTK